MIREYAITTALGIVRARIDAPERPIRLGELPALLIPLAEACEAAAVEKAGNNERPQCRKGCASCCRQLVTVSLAEMWALKGWVESLPEQAHFSILGRFAGARCELEADDFDHALRSINDPAIDTEAHFAMAREYFMRGIPCPFLVNETCSIHERRPLTCREYLALSPAGLCVDPFLHDVRRLFTAAPLAEALGMTVARKVDQIRRERLVDGGEKAEPAEQQVTLGMLLDWTDKPEPQETFDADELIKQVILSAEVLLGISDDE